MNPSDKPNPEPAAKAEGKTAHRSQPRAHKGATKAKRANSGKTTSHKSKKTPVARKGTKTAKILALLQAARGRFT